MIKTIALLLPVLFCMTVKAQNNALLEAEQKISDLSSEQSRLEFEQAQLKTQIADLTDKTSALKKQIRTRLLAQSKIQKFRWGELLLNSSYSELNTQLKTLKNLTEHDIKLFQNYKQMMSMYKMASDNLKETENLLRKNLIVLKNLQAELEQLEQIEVALNLKNKTESLLLFKGQLARPTNGTIIKSYGQLRDPNGQYYLMSNGELYKTSLHAEIKAVGPGVVIFRDQLAHWRETLVVQHAGRYYSVYAGLKNVSLQVGDAVTARQTLGQSRDELFYFELRYGGLAVNPNKWFKEQPK